VDRSSQVAAGILLRELVSVVRFWLLRFRFAAVWPGE
jgi:hypothetical protein